MNKNYYLKQAQAHYEGTQGLLDYIQELLAIEIDSAKESKLFNPAWEGALRYIKEAICDRQSVEHWGDSLNYPKQNYIQWQAEVMKRWDAYINPYTNNLKENEESD